MPRDNPIRALAAYLIFNEGLKGIKLKHGVPEAKLWAETRDICGIRDWSTLDEAEAAIREAIFQYVLKPTDANLNIDS